MHCVFILDPVLGDLVQSLVWLHGDLYGGLRA